MAAVSCCYGCGPKELQRLLADIKTCGKSKDLERGRKLHEAARSMGHESNNMQNARIVFDTMPKRDAVSYTAIMLGYAEGGQAQVALDILASMQSQGCCLPDPRTYVAALKACSSLGNVFEQKDVGLSVHLQAARDGCVADTYVSNALLNMYSRSGRMIEAWNVFQAMRCRTLVSWNTVILGYAETGEEERALELYANMKESFAPDSSSLVAVIKACSRLASKGGDCAEIGTYLQRDAASNGKAADAFVATMLIEMYGKASLLREAEQVFDQMNTHDVVSFTTLMSSCARNGEEEKAIAMLFSMRERGVRADHGAYIVALRCCSSLAARAKQKRCSILEHGREIHNEIFSSIGVDSVLANALVEMYSKCGSVDCAKQVFDAMQKHDMISCWAALMSGYTENGKPLEALELFAKLQDESVPDAQCIVAASKACSMLSSTCRKLALEKAMAVHRIAAKVAGQQTGNAIVDMFIRCGSVEDARKAFDSLKNPCLATWTILVLGYVEIGQDVQALELFESMPVQRDARAFLSGLRACAGLASRNAERALSSGMAIHKEFVNSGCSDDDLYVANTLILMYCKCHCLAEAKEVFDEMQRRNAVTWGTLVSGYAENGKPIEAIDLFWRMDCDPDAACILAALKACAAAALKEEPRLVEGACVKPVAMELARCLHAKFRSILQLDVRVANSLIDVYAKCGCMVLAAGVFNGIAHRTLASWNALMFGYAENGETSKALDLLQRMRSGGLQPDERSYSAALKACEAAGAALEAGRRVHEQAVAAGMLETSTIVTNALIDFYAKCGSMAEAESVFEAAHKAHIDVVSWTALMSGYARKGDSSRVLELFGRLRYEGVRLDGRAVACVLNACSHSGLVEEGKAFFEGMVAGNYGDDVTPTVEHYACVVDMLCRSNRVEEAIEVVNSAPFFSNNMAMRRLLHHSLSSRQQCVLIDGEEGVPLI